LDSPVGPLSARADLECTNPKANAKVEVKSKTPLISKSFEEKEMSMNKPRRLGAGAREEPPPDGMFEKERNTHASADAEERIAYKVAQAARATGVSRYVLYDAIRARQLPAFEPNPGGDFLILAEDLRAWVKRHPAKPRRRGGHRRESPAGDDA
jgi:excisionase family DNA binding protein